MNLSVLKFMGVKIKKIGLRWRGHCILSIEKDMDSNVSGADCYNVFVMVAFSPKARQALAY